MAEKVMFPHVFDSSMLASFRSCQQKGFLTYMEHWKPKFESVHLVAGAAFAKGLEVARESYYANSLSAEDSIALGLHALIESYGDYEPIIDTAKTLDRMMGAFEFFMTAYPLGQDGFEPAKFDSGKLGIEFSFAEPLEINHPITNQPIIYAGRCDMIGLFADGYYVEDDKTTTSLGASWSKQWELRSQFTGYAWAAKHRLGLDIQGALIRGVSILKTKYDTQQVMTYRPNWEIDRWYEQVHRDIKRLITSWEEEYFDYNLDSACGEYGGCSFNQICKSQTPQRWLPEYFDKRVWDPIGRKEVAVNDWQDFWQPKQLTSGEENGTT